MITQIDNLLNKITMYRLILYFLISLLGIAIVMGFFGILPYNPWAVIFSSLFLVTVSLATNYIFSKTFNAPVNVESAYITALILALIISPLGSFSDLFVLFWAAVLAMAAKYILAIKNKHLFNPAAVAVVLTGIGLNQAASWWVGNLQLMPFVIIGGILVARKIRREDMMTAFFTAAILTVSFSTLMSGHDLPQNISNAALHSPLFFFAFVMLTEPLTTPPTRLLQIIYAVLVGIMFAPQFHLGSFYPAPENALIIGNLFSYLVSPKTKLVLTLSARNLIAPDTYDFVFDLKNKISYRPGQYMEWTVPHKVTDNRGNRRFFTLASSPTEANLRLGIKFSTPGSSFKKALLNLDTQTPIVGSQLAGDFTLPRDKSLKLVFIAGGIGITPFRSILKYLIDKHEIRDIVMFYSNRTAEEIVYRDVLNAAENLGIKIIYVNTSQTGRLNADMIGKLVPDYLNRTYYLSGPHSLVTAFQNTLAALGIKDKNIITDYFPGFV